MAFPEIHQTKQIIGRTIKLRNVRTEDAAFIVALRTNEKKGRFLSSTSDDVKAQEKWIEGYLGSKGQAYFIITDLNDEPVGTVRLYDQQQDSFCWGSWILAEDAPAHYAIESALLVYYYALKLGFSSAHFDVRKGNHSVIRFHERFGALRQTENDLDIFFTLSKDSINDSLKKFKKYLPQQISIE